MTFPSVDESFGWLRQQLAYDVDGAEHEPRRAGLEQGQRQAQDFGHGGAGCGAGGKARRHARPEGADRGREWPRPVGARPTQAL
jgi:hypothetical protein